MSLPVLGVTARARPSVSVATLARSVVTSVTVPGEQGGPGPAGATGPIGITTGFGQVTYTERTLEPSDVFAPNERGQILFLATSVQDKLNAPFKDHVFWRDNKIIARAEGDLYDIKINLIVTSQVAGGQLRLDADVGSSFGPIDSDTQTLFKGALEQERVTFRIRPEVIGNFIANGCKLYLTSSVPITTLSETVSLAPISIQGLGPPQYGVYELWLAQGNVGTVADFLASLKSTEPGPPGADGVRATLVAAVPVSGHRVVRPAPGGVAPASASDVAQAGTAIGLALGAALAGDFVEIALAGEVEEPTWSWNPGPLYLGENGALTQIAPGSGFVQRVGVALAPTRIAVLIGTPTIKL